MPNSFADPFELRSPDPSCIRHHALFPRSHHPFDYPEKERGYHISPKSYRRRTASPHFQTELPRLELQQTGARHLAQATGALASPVPCRPSQSGRRRDRGGPCRGPTAPHRPSAPLTWLTHGGCGGPRWWVPRLQSYVVYRYLNGGELRENGKLEVQYIIILCIFKFHVSTIYTFDRL